MTVEILASRPASGKTEWLVSTIQEQYRSDPHAKITVILPAYAQEQQFKQRLVRRGGYFGIQILNLTRYCRTLLDHQRRLFKEAPFSMKQRLLNDSILELVSQEMLADLSRIADLPGFRSVVFERFSQLMLAGIQPDDKCLATFCNNDPQLAAIMRLYSNYWQRCWQFGWLDRDWLVPFTVNLLEKTEIQPQPLSLLIVDGFEHFNPAHLRLLQVLAPNCKRLIISLPLEPGNESAIYVRPQATLERLRRNFSNLEMTAPVEATFLPGGLDALSHSFYQAARKPANFPADQSVTLLAVQSPRAEVREGLRWLKKKLLAESEDGKRLLNYSDCVIISPEGEEYHDLLKVTAFEFGIPLLFSYREKLGQQPAILALLNLLQLPLEEFKRRMLLDVIRSPYFDLTVFGLHVEDALTLELISRKELIMSGWERWQQVLTQLQDVPIQQDDLFEEESILNFDLLDAATAERLLGGLNNLAALFQDGADGQALTFWVDWLKTLLESVNFLSQNAGSGKELIKALDELVMVENEMGTSLLGYAQFVQEITAVLQMKPVRVNSERMAAIQVLRIAEARAQRFACVVVHGLAEGVLPRIEREDPFLPEDFRAGLGLELQLQRHQVGQFFQLITRADQALLVTRPYLNDKGETLDPSPYWNELAACVHKDNIETIRPAQKRPLNEAASLAEALFWSGLYGYDTGTIFHSALQRETRLLQQQRQVYHDRQKTTQQGEYEGNLGSLIPPLDVIFTYHSVWSASRLEAYLACPMRFWVNYGLNARELPPPEPGVLPNQTGSILHEILEKVYRDSGNGDVETILENLPNVANEVFRQAPKKYSFEPSMLWEIQQEEWLPALQQTIRGLASSEWMPFCYEQKFGSDGLPALEIVSTAGKTIRIQGTIDRIDCNSNGQIRVIDYKTGASHLDGKDLLIGNRIQLPIYARAASDSLKLGEVVEGFYWAILIGKESQLKLSSFEFDTYSGPPAAQMVLEGHLEKILNGIENGRFSPTPPPDNCPEYCAAKGWCWHYRPAWRRK